MATPKKGPKAPKVGNYRGGTKTSVTGRGGFLGKTSSGGNLGRAAMANSAAASAAKGYGRSGGDASAFGIGAGASRGGGAVKGDNTSGAGVDFSSGGLTEAMANPGGSPYSSGYSGDEVVGPGAGPTFDNPGDVPPVDPYAASMQAAAFDSSMASSAGGVTMPPDLGPGKATVVATPTRTSTPTPTRTAAPTAAPAPTIRPATGTVLTRTSTGLPNVVVSDTGTKRIVNSTPTPAPVIKPPATTPKAPVSTKPRAL